jgi:hypothetical protein
MKNQNGARVKDLMGEVMRKANEKRIEDPRKKGGNEKKADTQRREVRVFLVAICQLILLEKVGVGRGCEAFKVVIFMSGSTMSFFKIF